MKEHILYLSLLLNIGGGILLFFRSAIDEIVRESWRERRHEKLDKVSNLNDVRKALQDYLDAVNEFIPFTQLLSRVKNESLEHRFHSVIKRYGGILHEEGHVVKKKGPFLSKNVQERINVHLLDKCTTLFTKGSVEEIDISEFMGIINQIKIHLHEVIKEIDKEIR